MIDGLTIQKIKYYDKKYGVKSKVFPSTSKIVVETPLDEYIIDVKNNKVHLYHKNKHGRLNKFHVQGIKGSIYACYDSIYKHKRCLCVLSTPSNTYKKEL